MPELNNEYLRGHMDTFILGVLRGGSKYGNEIRRTLSQKIGGARLNEQSLYSACHRLELSGCITGRWGDEKTGATRRYYTITEKGLAQYEQNRSAWQQAKRLIDILGE